jgi:hypothetical protein
MMMMVLTPVSEQFTGYRVLHYLHTVITGFSLPQGVVVFLHFENHFFRVAMDVQ